MFYTAGKQCFNVKPFWHSCLVCGVTMDANYSPDGVLGLQAEEEALSEGLDIVHTEEVVRRHIRCQVSCTHQHTSAHLLFSSKL